MERDKVYYVFCTAGEPQAVSVRLRREIGAFEIRRGGKITEVWLNPDDLAQIDANQFDGVRLESDPWIRPGWFWAPEDAVVWTDKEFESKAYKERTKA